MSEVQQVNLNMHAMLPPNPSPVMLASIRGFIGCNHTDARRLYSLIRRTAIVDMSKQLASQMPEARANAAQYQPETA